MIDRAIQVHGGGGVSDDFPLARMYAHLRTLRLADGPDEVHKLTIARRELRRLRRARRRWPWRGAQPPSACCLSSSARALISIPRSRSTSGPRITIPSMRPRSTSSE